MSNAAKYRKKPVVIEALQFTRHNGTEVSAFIGENEIYGTCDFFEIETLEGEIYASPGDFIIKGVQGEFYPCKPDIFLATYDAVEDEAK